jgi:hypothetical protein
MGDHSLGTFVELGTLHLGTDMDHRLESPQAESHKGKKKKKTEYNTHWSEYFFVDSPRGVA